MPVDNKLVKQLKDKDPKVRRKAIVALADSRDLDALGPLEEVARKDPDDKLRALAVRAQNHIKEQYDRAAERESAEESGGGQAAAPARKVKVDEKDVARARGFMDEALSYSINRDNAKATKALVKALQVNPGLRNDTYFLSLASQVLNVDQHEAVQVLSDAGRRSEVISSSKQAQARKKKDEHYSQTDELPWSAMFFDLGVFTAVVAVITFLAPLVVVQMIGRLIEYQATLSAEDLAAEAVAVSGSSADVIGALGAVSIVAFLIIALATALATAVSTLIQGGVVHLIATKVLGGNGTMRYMMCQILPFYSMTTLVLFVWWCIAMGLLAIGAGLIGLLCLAPMSFASLYIFFKVTGKIGQAYDFGSLKGCLSLVLAQLALTLIASIPGILVWGSVQAWLENAVMTGMGF